MPINRRISIVVLNKRTEEAIMRDGNIAEVDNAEAATEAVDSGSEQSPAGNGYVTMEYRGTEA